MTNDSQVQEFQADDQTAVVIVAALRQWLPQLSWSKIRNLIRSRRVAVGHALCLDESRRLHPGERVQVFEQPLRRPPTSGHVEVHFVDRDIVVVEKPPGMVTLRHKRERRWQASKKRRQPTLDEVIPDLIYASQRKQRPALLSVHRIDRDTSGLLVFARSSESQRALVEQFAAHDVVRVYRAIVPGHPREQTIRSRIVRDRGDGLRGSTDNANDGKDAVTHIKPLRSFRLPGGEELTEIECSLETGRTHQIRIHLTELGHPVCGDTRYRSRLGETEIEDFSGVPRLALHAAELGFAHPTKGTPMHFAAEWPREMAAFLKRLSGGSTERPAGAARVARSWR